MVRVICVLAAFVLLSSCASTAQQPSAMLPPELSEYEDFWHGLGDPPLWRDGDLGEHQSRIRALFATGLVHNGEAIIRIDRDTVGDAHGVFIRGEQTGRQSWLVRERRTFRVSRVELDRLDALIAQSRLFSQYPQFWVPADDPTDDEESICIDGVEVILERVNAAGYRFSEANVQCAAPAEFFAVTRELIRMSGEPELEAWLE